MSRIYTTNLQKLTIAVITTALYSGVLKHVSGRSLAPIVVSTALAGLAIGISSLALGIIRDYQSDLDEDQDIAARNWRRDGYGLSLISAITLFAFISKINIKFHY